MDVDVNYLAVVLAALSSMVVGAVWYAKPVFGGMWAKWVGLSDDAMKKGSAKPLILAFVLSLVMAYILAHVSYLSNLFFGHSFMQDAVTTAFWLWLGVAFTLVLTHDSFERRPLRLTIVNVTNMLVTMLVMGAIIGALPPKSLATADQPDIQGQGATESPCAGSEADC